jgi:hypothetical protein
MNTVAVGSFVTSLMVGTVMYGTIRGLSDATDIKYDEKKLRLGISVFMGGHFIGDLYHICPIKRYRFGWGVTNGIILYFINKY